MNKIKNYFELDNKKYLKQSEKICYGRFDGSAAKRINDLQKILDVSLNKEFPQYFSTFKRSDCWLCHF